MVDCGMSVVHRLFLPLAFGLLTPVAAPLGAEPQLECRGPQGGHTGAAKVCAALKPLLGARAGQVQLDLTRDEPMALAGRLSWSVGGQKGRGPVVDVTTSDRPLDGRAPERLARGLIAVSDLP